MSELKHHTYNLQFDLMRDEGQFVEFKENLDKNFAKELAAFANASGGVIYLGVTDAGQIKGIEITNRLKSQIQDLARNCDPQIVLNITENENVLVIEVPEGANKPYSCSTGFFMRMGANAQKMTRNEIFAPAVKSGKIRYDEQICANFDRRDFDSEKFEYYLKLARISNNLPREEILRNLRVLTDEGFTNAGVLYFAKEPYKYIITSKIRCIHFNDDERVDVLDKKVVDKGIIGNIEFAVEYLQARVPVRYEMKKLERDEFPEYPPAAYREAIVNAVIHFDYFMGDTIAVEKLKSSIVINNKGELLFPESDFGKRSEARNRLIADLLVRTDYMEKAGTEIKRITDACKANSNTCDFGFSDAFWITIHSNITQEEKVTEKVTENQQLILESFTTNPYLSSKELATIIGITPEKIRTNLSKLKTKGLIERIGPDKGGYWKIIK